MRRGEDRLRSQLDFLAERAGLGPVLEASTSRGQLASSLVAQGLEVTTVAPPLVATTELPLAPFTLAYAIDDALFGLTSQEAQLEFVAAVAAHLLPDAALVIEASVPSRARWLADGGLSVGPASGTVTVGELGPEGVVLEAWRHDLLSQRVDGQRIELTEGNVHLRPVTMRYAWPSELDLMALLAQLGLEERVADFYRSLFTSASPSHVSVYRR